MGYWCFISSSLADNLGFIANAFLTCLKHTIRMNSNYQRTSRTNFYDAECLVASAKSCLAPVRMSCSACLYILHCLQDRTRRDALSW